ncbi:helix-turn-helix domain-containing protein [Rhizobium beringeri]
MKKLRVKRGLSQERLALEAGLERVSISQIERKAGEPRDRFSRKDRERPQMRHS